MSESELTIHYQDYEKIAQAIRFLEHNRLDQPRLADIAKALNMSEYHFQRLFSRWVGISPKRFVQYLTKEHAKFLLNQSEDLFNTALSVGLSGPSRLHDMFVTCEAMTPGEYKARGDGMQISYGFHPSPFGDCLIGVTSRGICSLVFVQDNDYDAALSNLMASWPAANFNQDQDVTNPVIPEMLALFQHPASTPMRIYLQGTNFQLKVWEALLDIPAGSVVSYKQVAIQVGLPQGSRAVGNALAKNPLAVLIPCHRVIHTSGDFGQYRYGTVRKKALLGWEQAKIDQERPVFSMVAG